MVVVMKVHIETESGLTNEEITRIETFFETLTDAGVKSVELTRAGSSTNVSNGLSCKTILSITFTD